MRYLRTYSFNKVKIFWESKAFARNTLASVWLQNRKQQVSKSTIHKFLQIQDFKMYAFRHQTVAVNILLSMNKFFTKPPDSQGLPSDHEPQLCSHWSATVAIVLRCALFMNNGSVSQLPLDMIKLS